MPKINSTKDNSEIQKALGATIERRLKEKGVSRKQLAEQIHVSQNSVANYIKGEQKLSFDTICAVSDALNLTISELFAGDFAAIQTREQIKKSVDSALHEYKLKSAVATLETVGWECHKLENGEWQLFRQKTFEEIFSSLSLDNPKVKCIRLPDGDNTLISLAEQVERLALDTLKQSEQMKTLNSKLDNILSVDK